MNFWIKLFKFGFPTCHERCARHYQLVIYDIGTDFEMSFKMSLN